VSHHFDTPTAREDPRLNLCDFYLFAGTPGTTVMAMTVNAAATVASPAPFRDEALYVFRFDTDGDHREDVSFKVRFGELVHVSTDGVERHAQTFDVRFATGDNAVAGGDGQMIAAGTTGAVVLGDNGIRAFAGVVNDVFGGDAVAVNDFKDSFAAGFYKPEAFNNRVNFFADRTVGGIVIEVPNALLGKDKPVHAWSTVSLYGHAPEQQVARWGLPLFTHLFLNDDDLREAFNRTPLSGDHASFIASTVDTVTKYVTLAGTSPEPPVYARRVAELFGLITLPYTVGTPASFDYTGFNGRALGDNVMDNMLSVLTNSPLGTGIAPDPGRICGDFPYFSRPVRT
jgi:Domain of unknown function (DUF4331)